MSSLNNIAKQIDILTKWYDAEKAGITDKDHKITPAAWQSLAVIMSSEIEICKAAILLSIAQDLHKMREALVRDKDEQS